MTSQNPASAAGLVLSNTGSYPRIGDTPELQLLRRTIAAMDRGEKTATALTEAENEMTRKAIAEQVRAGVEQLTDGQVRWYDAVSHVAGKLEGVKVNGLLRFFDTNFYFRQPVLTAPPTRNSAGRSELVEEYRFAQNALAAMAAPGQTLRKRNIKPVLTGPYTLAKFSLVENQAMSALEARAQAYAAALAAEVAALVEAGAQFIQIDEPAILKYPDDWPVFVRALEPLVRAKQEAVRKTNGGRQVELALYIYFHDCAQLYGRLVQLPVDVLGLDFTYNPKLVDVVAAAGSPLALGLGLVDGRNTRLEEPAALARQIEKLLPRIAGEHAYLGPSCGLEYLPRNRAYAKLELLGRVRAVLNG